MRRLITRARARPLLTAGFVIALAATGFFAVRLALFTLYWSDPSHAAQPIAGWMTPGYVAKSWDVPRNVVGNALGLPPEPGQPRKTLNDLARDRGLQTSELIAALEAAIAAHRARAPGSP